jgi:hypothetical protein
MFTERDLDAIREHGIPEGEVRRQFGFFEKPPFRVQLLRPASIGDGIERFDEEDLARFAERAERTRLSGRMAKFIPASGRASRMFQGLSSLLGKGDAPGEDDISRAEACFRALPRFAFYEALGEAARKAGMDLDGLAAGRRFPEIARLLLEPEGLGYGELPKALLSFHLAGGVPRTAFEEHLVEAASCVKDKNGVCRAHFTIPPGTKKIFEESLASAAERLEPALEARFDVTFSIQRPCTDTVAVTPDNAPFRKADGSILFWAGGHGANLENLNAFRGDIVFVSNIDNVPNEKVRAEVCRWRLALAGCLIDIQERLFEILPRVFSKVSDEKALGEAMRFAEKRLRVSRPELWDEFSREDRRSFLIDRLNRPLRVCGVVPNTGEPGGGPFWVQDRQGASLQIVEKSQVDSAAAQQAEVFAASSHFNPVDMACGVRDYLGEPFDLGKFSDPEAVFIAEKSWEGSRVRVLEHPGLWNGSMARWNTIFVETPLWTFNPAKTLSDLLREGHQP